VNAVRQAPLSFSQERFWFMERLIEGIPLHHYPFAFRIEGDLDVDALEGAIREMVRRHEILRTRFPKSPPTAVQEVLYDWEPMLEKKVIEPGPEAEAKTRDWMRDFGTRRFDLVVEPGFRGGLASLLGPRTHVLMLVHHHIAFDGWSRGLIANEIGGLYAALRRGEEAELPSLPFQYADYAIWQRERVAGDHGRYGRTFWVRELTGAPTDLDLPADRPRPPKPTYRGDRRYSYVPQETRAALDALAAGERATPFMALLTAFQVLVHRYTGLKDFLIGIPVAGRRDHPGVDSLVGPFVNTMVLRADLSGDPGFRALLRRVRATALRSLPQQEHPFEDVVEAIGPERSLSRNPLFQVMLNYRSYPGRPFELEGLECEEIRASAGMSEVDLMLAALAWRPGPLELEWVYASDRFEESTIERMSVHFERLLRAIASDPDRPVEELPILSEEERRSLLRWGCSDEPAVSDSMVSRIEASARRDPDRPAIVLGERRLIYGELAERSSRVASALRARGKGPASLVGICLDRSPELFVSIVGVLASGAAYLPLDPSSPDDRMRYLIEHAGVDLVLCDESLADRVRGMGPEVVLWDLWSEEPPGQSAHQEDAGDLAYVIYTSGSTGRPKGVQIERRSVANFTDWAVREIGLSPVDRVLQFCSIGFDVSILEFLPTLTSGATLVLRDPGPPPSPSGFSRWLEEHAITVAILPTAYWHGWAAHVARAGSSAVPASLRLVVVAGEKALPAPYAGWRASAPRSVRWINGYGPTEATILATAFEPDSGKAWSPAEDIPIGSPIAGSRVYVLDGRMQPVPVGVPGEIGLGGPGIATGYRNDPDRTIERFFDDPFRPGGRLYRTGDRGRWRPDGRLEFLGRVDDQLKIRGYRVEPAEVEAHLADHPGVAAGAVVAREVGGGQLLVGYVAPVAGRRLEAAEIREWLTGRLPDYMVPGIIEVLEEMPLTASGKVDRVALPPPSHAGARGAFLAPRTPVEHALVGIWQRLLGVERVGIGDDFFSLGGHSLIALQVIAEAERALDRSVPLSLVFEYPTIEDLAAAIERESVV
jgi:amino acid adenylation domain-containing protein